jgi:AraC-like DNA-binding protein
MRHESYSSHGAQKYQPKGYRFTEDHYHPFQMIYVSWGELVFQADGTARTLGPGQLMLLRQGSAFQLSSPRVSYRGVSFHATGDVPSAFRGCAEALHATAEIRTIAQQMERQFDQPCPEAALVLDGLGRSLTWEAIRILGGATDSSAGQSGAGYAHTARQVLDATLCSARSAREALRSLPLSYRQISRHFVDTFGLTPKQYQLQARNEEAKRLLRETNLSITTIAMELGYCSSQHFATQFLKHIGQLPSGYRNRIKQESLWQNPVA